MAVTGTNLITGTDIVAPTGTAVHRMATANLLLVDYTCRLSGIFLDEPRLLIVAGTVYLYKFCDDFIVLFILWDSL